MTDKEKIIQYLDYKGFSKNSFYKKTGLSTGFLDSGNSLGLDKLRLILDNYHDFNSDWLIKNKGEMILNNTINESVMVSEPMHSYGNKKNKIPFFNLPVSAGRSLEEVYGAKQFDGYLYNIEGLGETEYVLPVKGYSMQPEVKDGSIIGVRKLKRWERSINTEHKYLVVTSEDRMIKYLAPDDEDETILWCISHNYPKFKVYKEDIVEIHRITFVLNQ